VYPVIPLEGALEIDEGALSVDEREATDLEDATEPGVAADGGDPSDPHGSDETNADGVLVRIRESVRPVALRCDSFGDQEEVVVKPLEGSLSGVPGLSGSAILDDGNIVPILDVVSLEE
jgi:two-component system chemotaxis sensor kinase CheA